MKIFLFRWTDNNLWTTCLQEQEFLAHSKESSGSDKDQSEDQDVCDGRLSVFLFKREEMQSSHEVIQPLISLDSRSFRINSAANIERIVRMDRDMTKVRLTLLGYCPKPCSLSRFL